MLSKTLFTNFAITTLLLLLGSYHAKAEDFLPSVILNLNTYLSHHILIAEKSTHKLYLFENADSNPKLVKTYQMATGKKSGDKVFQGDHRTPEGVYVFTQFVPREELLRRHGKEGEIYGIGAFVMNYPNPMDSSEQKTGSGIWLHSTNDETRIEKGLDSRGCVVVANNDLKDLSHFLEINKSQIIIVENINYLNSLNWNNLKNTLLTFIDTWKTSWAEENLAEYEKHYHPVEFKDPSHKNFTTFVNYKKMVFSNPGKPIIELKYIEILQADKYATINFIQDYTSNTIKDIGKKTLYLKQDEFYNWKIVAERWTKAGIEDYNKLDKAPSFIPSNRFFDIKSNHPDNRISKN